MTPSELEVSIKNQQVMMNIVQSMKEIPVLPSEVPSDVATLEKVEILPAGGILTYMSNHGYPYRGFPFFEFVERTDYIKKTVRSYLSGLYHSLKDKPKVFFITLLPALWILKYFIRAAAYTFYRNIERSRVKPEIYSKSIKALYDAFGGFREHESEKRHELRFLFRDLICMVLEFDNAYRFRLQDIAEDINQEAIKKNVIKELIRLLSVAQSREKTQPVKDTWTLFKYLIRFYLRFDKDVRIILRDVLQRVNLEEVKLTDEDKYYTVLRQDYTFKWMTELEDKPKKDNDRKLYDVAYFYKDVRETEEKVRSELIKTIDLLNTAQAEEKVKFPEQDFTEKHKKEQEELDTRFKSEAAQRQTQYEQGLQELRNKYLN